MNPQRIHGFGEMNSRNHRGLYIRRYSSTWIFFLLTISDLTVKDSSKASSASASLGLGYFNSFELLDFKHLNLFLPPSSVLSARSSHPHPASSLALRNPQAQDFRFQLFNLLGNMSSTGHVDVNAASESSRRSTRERKVAQHFGHSEPSEELEELVSRP